MISIHSINNPETKSQICDKILRALPDWFGVESSIVDYVRDVAPLTFFAAMNADIPVGFVALKRHNPYTVEVYVMGLLREFHRRGIGKRLIEACEDCCRREGTDFLTVKALDESRADEGYGNTRKFYLAMDFRPLEVFPTLWDPANPCLFMAKALHSAD